MRFVVFGAGGVGGVVGGRLSQHGHDVALIARGAHYRAIRDRGLRLESPDAAETLRLPVVDHPDHLEWTSDDVVLLAVKSQDCPAALDALLGVAPAAVPVVCLQNGVANERMALQRFPNVYAVCVWCPAGHLRPGLVQAFSTPVTGILDVGRYPAGIDTLAEAIAKAFRAATFYSAARADVMRWKYRKLLSNLGNAVDALCGSGARGTAVLADARREGAECFTAAGIDVASDDEEPARREKQLHLRPIGDEVRPGGSTWQSLARATGSIETDYLNGEIVALGRAFGIPTPVNALLQRLVREAAEEGRPPGTMRIDEIESMLS